MQVSVFVYEDKCLSGNLFFRGFLTTVYTGIYTGISHQRPISPLARRARSTPCICYLSKLSASFLQPSEHVGEHSGGVVGWRAAWGSGGITGGWTGGGGAGGELGGAVAQAVASDASAVSSSSRAAGLVFGFTGDLLVFANPCLLDGAVLGRQQQGLGVSGGQVLGRLAALGLQLGAQVGHGELGAVQAPGLDAGQADQAGDDAEDDQLDAEQAAQTVVTAPRHGAALGVDAAAVMVPPCGAPPSHMARSVARRLGRPPQRWAGSRQSRPWK